jgi:spermidine synthase
MKRYGGTLIHGGRDKGGVLEVVDAHGVRSLHFGTRPRQSAMSLAEPDRLELAYIRAMLSVLLFIAKPERVLLLGLGGGSLARFLLSHYPRCRIDAVERRADVAEIAHRYFDLPRDPRLAVHIADAYEYCDAEAQMTEAAYDLILVDAYDHQGMDQSVNAEEFFRACTRLLRPLGALAMNLWGTQKAAFKQSAEWLRACFPGRAFKLPVPNKGNVIGLAVGEQFGKPDLEDFIARAKNLEIQLGLEMPYFLRHLRGL